MAAAVVGNRAILKAIEESEKEKVRELSPLPPMLDTLAEYLKETETPPLRQMEFLSLIGLDGGIKSKSYEVSYKIA